MSTSALQLWSTTRSAVSCLQQGQLHMAAALLSEQQQREAWPFRWLAAYVMRRLVRNAYWHWAQSSFNHAWADFSAAEQVCSERRRDWLQLQKSRLVEETIASADRQLLAGQITPVIAALEALEKRGVRDWRATRSLKTARTLQTAEEATRNGDWSNAVQSLEQELRERPEMQVLRSRLEAIRRLAAEFRELKQQMFQAVYGRRSETIKELAEKLLALSPQEPDALAVLSRLDKRGSGIIAPASANSNLSCNFQLKADWNEVPDGIEELCASPKFEKVSNHVRLSRFMLWIDRVGGYLVCPGPIVTAGNYVDQPGVEIPLQADLWRRHLRLERQGRQFFLVPLGPASVNGKVIRRPTLLDNKARIELPGQLCLEFSQPHPLSSSARLDYLSPHRTVPSSDGILLLGDSLIIGPNRCDHVCVPYCAGELILFRRQDQLFLRSDVPMRIDGRTESMVSPIGLESSISGADGEFSLKIEPV